MDTLTHPHTIFLAHVAATWTMVGVIWVMQLVHYPLFAYVGTETYTTYQTLHMNRITWIVLPVMALELITAVALVAGYGPDISSGLAWTGAGLLALIWALTGLVHAPLHGALSSGFDPQMHRWLVGSNWLRTLAWSIRGVLVLWMLKQTLATS